MSQKIKRVGSNIDTDAQSIILSGNLSEIPRNVDFFDSEGEEDFEAIDIIDESRENVKKLVDEPTSTFEDYQRANQICGELYGIDLLDLVTKLVLNEQLDAKDFVVQSLAYKVQSLVRGSTGIR